MTEHEITSKSWKQMKPNGLGIYMESFPDYLERINDLRVFNHIPAEVFEQWIYPLHQDTWTLRNYAWLDFTSVQFELQKWTEEKLLKIQIIPDFQSIIAEIDHPLQEVAALKQDVNTWESQGTWRVPPIILDVYSLPVNRPHNATITGPFQLVEGHSRYRNLLISKNKRKPLAQLHEIYLMKFEKHE